YSCYFFFQAEDGIRDFHVTGVQTCALPIYKKNTQKNVLITGAAGFLGSHLCDKFIREGYRVIGMDNLITGDLKNIEHLFGTPDRSEERRVGKECRYRCSRGRIKIIV